MTMNGKISTWGNSLALRIPRDYAQTLGLSSDTPVTLELSQGGLLIRPTRQRPSLDDLLRGVTPELIGGEEEWGQAQGQEEW